MKTKEQIAKELNISRKSLYNYINELKIKELDEFSVSKIKDYLTQKNKSKEITKAELLEQIENLKKQNTALTSKNEKLEEEQTVLLNQLEWYRNSIDSEIKQIKENMVLLLNPPKQEKKSLLSKLFNKQ